LEYLKEEIKKIINSVTGEQLTSITEIINFGSVNNVFDVACQKNNYIVRLNKDKNKRLEFLKEEWCINNVKELGVLVPKVLHNGIYDGFPFMIQEKIKGVNGSTCNKIEKMRIWKSLGKYSLKYSQIKQIEIPELIASEFHANWKSRLEYNIEKLNTEDSLLTNKVFSLREHVEIRRTLISLRGREYKVGLIHGDLSPRNVIINESSLYLIDWGTAEINIVPHSEIGIILIEGEANALEFQSFLEGMEIDQKEYVEKEFEIRILNILHRLDKYRWAAEYDVENLENYEKKLRQEYSKMIELK